MQRFRVHSSGSSHMRIPWQPPLPPAHANGHACLLDVAVPEGRRQRRPDHADIRTRSCICAHAHDRLPICAHGCACTHLHICILMHACAQPEYGSPVVPMHVSMHMVTHERASRTVTHTTWPCTVGDIRPHAMCACHQVGEHRQAHCSAAGRAQPSNLRRSSLV